jgi:hypothetical protein
VDLAKLLHERASVAAYLSGADLAADLAALLGRWTEPGRPGVLLVRDGDPPFAKVYPEDELIDAFPDAQVIPAGPIGDLGPGTLLVVVIDVEGETAYVIPDPRSSN